MTTFEELYLACRAVGLGVVCSTWVGFVCVMEQEMGD